VAGHYSAHIGIAPSFKLTGFLRVNYYRGELQCMIIKKLLRKL